MVETRIDGGLRGENNKSFVSNASFVKETSK